MSAAQHLIAIDQGTSSSRTEFPQEYPQPGWVEHDPEAIWNSVLEPGYDPEKFGARGYKKIPGCC